MLPRSRQVVRARLDRSRSDLSKFSALGFTTNDFRIHVHDLPEAVGASWIVADARRTLVAWLYGADGAPSVGHLAQRCH